jgi:hypothetical protein
VFEDWQPGDMVVWNKEQKHWTSCNTEDVPTEFIDFQPRCPIVRLV